MATRQCSKKCTVEPVHGQNKGLQDLPTVTRKVETGALFRAESGRRGRDLSGESWVNEREQVYYRVGRPSSVGRGGTLIGRYI